MNHPNFFGKLLIVVVFGQVVKKSGIIIKPIKYEDLSVCERTETGKSGAKKQRKGKAKKSTHKKA